MIFASSLWSIQILHFILDFIQILDFMRLSYDNKMFTILSLVNWNEICFLPKSLGCFYSVWYSYIWRSMLPFLRYCISKMCVMDTHTLMHTRMYALSPLHTDTSIFSKESKRDHNKWLSQISKAYNNMYTQQYSSLPHPSQTHASSIGQ